jgi:hypothetical protein
MDTKYVIFSSSELDKIDFTEVMESSAETVRRSVDGSKTFVKYTSDTMPASIVNLTTKEGPYTVTEMLHILSTIEWNLDKQTSVSGSI